MVQFFGKNTSKCPTCNRHEHKDNSHSEIMVEQIIDSIPEDKNDARKSHQNSNQRTIIEFLQPKNNASDENKNRRDGANQRSQTT